MGFTRWTPKVDCFRDLLIVLDPGALDRVLRGWLDAVPGSSGAAEALAGVSLDGKSLCATLRHNQTVNLAATLRSFTRKAQRLLTQLGFVK